MKKSVYLIVVLVALAIIAVGCTNSVAPTIDKAKPVKDECTTIQSGELYASDGTLITTGYDEWGYNYQAHMFNGYYCDSYRDAAWCQPYKDVQLMMKWNDAWISNKDCDGDGLLDRHFGYDSYIGSGAWLTNHQSGTYWSLIGDWVLEFDYNGSKYIHNMTITDDIFNGTGTNGSITWTVNGKVVGNQVEMTIEYDHNNYYVGVSGTIDDDGTMSGTWMNASQEGTWESTTGTATSCDWNYFVKIVAAPADAYKVPENANGSTILGIWYNADGTEIGPVIWGQFATIQQVENDPCAGIHGVQYKSPAGPGFGQYGPE